MTAKKRMPIEFSPHLIDAVHTVVSAIYCDAAEFCEDNEELIELVLDADRLLTFADPQAEEEASRLIDLYGFDKVRKQLSAKCNYI